jgi:peptide/nickel transport system substrate-binding protein
LSTLNPNATPSTTVSRLLGDSSSRRSLLKRAAATSSLAALLGGTLGVSPTRIVSAQATPRTLTIGLNGGPSDLDPHSQYDYRSAVAVRGAYEGLIQLVGASADQYEGLIAERWESNAERSVWTFHLRDGVTFHDGSPCDAEAVRASFERLLTMRTGAYNVIARFITDPAQIATPDSRTLVFDLGRPQPLFEAALSGSYGTQVVNVAVAREHEADGDFGNGWLMTNAEGAGSGPYRIVDFQPGEQLTLERYDGYWAGWEGEHFDRIVLRTVPEPQALRLLLERGEVDLTDRFSLPPAVVKELEGDQRFNVQRNLSTEIVYYAMTVAGPLTSPQARQAMCYAFPYEEVNQGVYEGYATQPRGGVAARTRGFDPDTFQYGTDLAKARELLAAAGVAEGTTLTAMQILDDTSESVATLFQGNLAELGLDLTIQQVDVAVFTAAFYGDLPLEERPNFFLWSWWPSYNDGWNHLQPQVSCTPRGAANGGFYCNAQVDALLQRARDAATLEEYGVAMSELQQIISRDDPPAVYFSEPEYLTVMQRDIQGVTFNPFNLGTYDFHKLYREPA